MLHMLDINTASYVIKGRSPAVDNTFAEIPPSLVCGQVKTRAELLYGLKRLPANHSAPHRSSPVLRIVRVPPWDEEAGFYAEVRHQLVMIGQPIGEMDMTIAAHSLSVGAVLVTNNTPSLRAH